MDKIIEFLKKYFEKSRVDFKAVLFLLCLGASFYPEVVGDLTRLVSESLLDGFKPFLNIVITWYFFYRSGKFMFICNFTCSGMD